jgi:acetoin utilization deacetylase AcuC-like enzyme
LAIECLHTVHDPAFVGFLQTAYSRWQEEGRGGSMLPSGFPARSLRRDRVPEGVNGRWGITRSTRGRPSSKARGRRHSLRALRADGGQPGGGGARAAYALCRPPGHHAARSVYGGYCYLNNAALAAQALRDAGFARVAVLDIDYHHGNGTQDIFYSRGDVFFASLHGTPETEYPYFLGFADERGEGAGEGTTLNLPLPRGTGWAAYAEALDVALRAIERFSADALVVSLGVDTFEDDPISSFALGTAHFVQMGARIAALRRPTVLVQEGGYAVEAIGRM